MSFLSIIVISLSNVDNFEAQLWFSDTWAPDEHFIPTLVRVSVDSHLHVLQVYFNFQHIYHHGDNDDGDDHREDDYDDDQDHSADKYQAVPGVIAPELIIRYTIFEEAAPEG